LSYADDNSVLAAVPGGVMHERKSSVLSVGKAHHAALPNVPGDLTHERKGSVHSVGSVPPYHAPRSSVELMFMNDSKGNSHQLPPSAPAQNPKVAKEKRSDLCASEASPPSAPPLNLVCLPKASYIMIPMKSACALPHGRSIVVLLVRLWAMADYMRALFASHAGWWI